MELKFYLPTEEDWYGTFDGGYVERLFHNGIQPTNITKDHCDWKYFIIIVFQGNDDMMWRKSYEISEEKRNEETIKALEMIANIPLPVTKKYLETIGFENES